MNEVLASFTNDGFRVFGLDDHQSKRILLSTSVAKSILIFLFHGIYSVVRKSVCWIQLISHRQELHLYAKGGVAKLARLFTA